MAKKEALETPTLLSYERSVHPTDAVFRSRSSKDGKAKYVPIPVETKAVLGTQSQYMPDPDDVKGGGNPQRIEVATMPPDHDMLAVSWSLAVTGSALKPHACDIPAFRGALVDFMTAYVKEDGFRTIASRIAANVLNARWMWRNRMMASSMRVVVEIAGGDVVSVADAFAIPLDSFGAGPEEDAIAKLAEPIAAALRGEGLARMVITAYAELAPGSMVYPSQEFVDLSTDKTEIKKKLFAIPADECRKAAAFHEQKIGNALRTFDTWHGGETECGVGASAPIAVNPYGQDRASQGVVRRGVRSGKGNANFYDLLKKSLQDITEKLHFDDLEDKDEAHFVAANLVRGGVFGFESKEKKAAARKSAGDAAVAETTADA